LSDIFKNLSKEAFRAGITPRTKESIEWMIKRAEDMGKIKARGSLMREEELVLKSKSLNGQMIMFFYDPKGKKTLPYYDEFPLTVVVDKAPGGFYGLNLHYLPPILRAKLLEALMEITTNKAYDETTRMRFTYEKLKDASNFKWFKPCFKHYLTKHTKSRFAVVPADEWVIATFLPTADWQKTDQSGAKVYSDSRKQLR
jgi:hypothetical protein